MILKVYLKELGRAPIEASNNPKVIDRALDLVEVDVLRCWRRGKALLQGAGRKYRHSSL